MDDYPGELDLRLESSWLIIIPLIKEEAAPVGVSSNHRHSASIALKWPEFLWKIPSDHVSRQGCNEACSISVIMTWNSFPGWGTPSG